MSLRGQLATSVSALQGPTVATSCFLVLGRLLEPNCKNQRNNNHSLNN